MSTKSKDEFPFYAFTSIISPDTSSVSDAQGNEEGGGDSGAANAPVEGLYFFHTDHLGSVTMLTNTAGEVVTGTSIGSGRSMVSYTPYGEIDRVHSGGPDIYRYKYTGQEEDKETGLYYYKARYYDPKIGRFLQPDTVLQTSSPFGTNQYMYVEGNPVMYNDPSGHWKLEHVTKGRWARNLRNGIERLTFGRHHRSRGKPWRTFSDKIGQTGTFFGRILKDPYSYLGLFGGVVAMFDKRSYLGGVLIGGVDYLASTISGNKPSIIYKQGSFGIKNSYWAGNIKGNSFHRGGVAHIQPGDGLTTTLHEFGHVRQFFKGSKLGNTPQLMRELDADLHAGTMRYGITRYFAYKFLPDNAYQPYLLANAAMGNLASLNLLDDLNRTDSYNENSLLNYFISELPVYV